MKSTDYYNTFIEVAEDCPVTHAEVPVQKGEKKSAILLQFEMIAHHPYVYTSDDVLFAVHATRNGLAAHDKAERDAFFSIPKACLRASPLGKRYGWGIHYNAKGKMALYGLETDAYQQFKSDPALEHTRAVRNKRA